jgi:hypothetical protein
MLTEAEKREQLAAKAGASSGGDLVIPEIPRVELPPDVSARFPTLAEWNRRHYAAWSDWRQRVNVALTRLRETT